MYVMRGCGDAGSREKALGLGPATFQQGWAGGMGY